MRYDDRHFELHKHLSSYCNQITPASWAEQGLPHRTDRSAEYGTTYRQVSLNSVTSARCVDQSPQTPLSSIGSLQNRYPRLGPLESFKQFPVYRHCSSSPTTTPAAPHVPKFRTAHAGVLDCSVLLTGDLGSVSNVPSVHVQNGKALRTPEGVEHSIEQMNIRCLPHAM